MPAETFQARMDALWIGAFIKEDSPGLVSSQPGAAGKHHSSPGSGTGALEHLMQDMFGMDPESEPAGAGTLTQPGWLKLDAAEHSPGLERVSSGR